MEDISSIVKETLINLGREGKTATPNNYHKEFCKVSKKHKFVSKDCSQFQELVNKLNNEEKQEILKLKIETIEDMIPILLKRVSSKNVKSLSSLVNKTLTPSISLELDDNLSKFSIKIGNNPALIFEDDIQKEMQKFIIKRYEADKSIVKQKTEDIAKLVTLMGKYLNDAIHSSVNSSSSVSNIKGQLEAFNISNANPDELSKLQTKLIAAASSIENEMQKVGVNFNSSKNQIKSLEKEVKELKSQITTIKKESKYDFLTKLLTRKAYEVEVKNFESNYLRNSVYYAIIFLDIDHFKNINDTYGHDAGDVILSTFAKVLKHQTRKIDIIGRYGGEEFIAIVHYNNEEDLTHYLSRIKSIVHENAFIYKDQEIKIKFSAGVVLRHLHESYEEALKQADDLLYEAKNSGRDKIILENGTII